MFLGQRGHRFSELARTCCEAQKRCCNRSQRDGHVHPSEEGALVCEEGLWLNLHGGGAAVALVGQSQAQDASQEDGDARAAGTAGAACVMSNNRVESQTMLTQKSQALVVKQNSTFARTISSKCGGNPKSDHKQSDCAETSLQGCGAHPSLGGPH